MSSILSCDLTLWVALGCLKDNEMCDSSEGSVLRYISGIPVCYGFSFYDYSVQ
jgi:hypothetical protein